MVNVLVGGQKKKSLPGGNSDLNVAIKFSAFLENEMSDFCTSINSDVSEKVPS